MVWHITDSVEEFPTSNPTSNAPYQRLGHLPVADRRTMEFPA